jgi:hypothetical protein
VQLTGLLEWNTILWVVGNLTALSIAVSALAFSVLYRLFFNPRLTSAGASIERAVFSVAGFGVLAVIGLFLDGSVDWWILPEHTAWWRPTLRMVVYGYIAYAFGHLVYTLVVYRFFPRRVKARPFDVMTRSPVDVLRERFGDRVGS